MNFDAKLKKLETIMNPPTTHFELVHFCLGETFESVHERYFKTADLTRNEQVIFVGSNIPRADEEPPDFVQLDDDLS